MLFGFLRRRTLSSVLPLLAVLLGVFVLVRLTGDPARLYLPLNATPQARAEFAARNGFDDPILEQLWHYLGGVVRLDFGESLRTGQDAAAMAFRAFPATLQLAGTTMLVAIAGAVVLGSWAALRPNSIGDRISSALSTFGASVPDFWFAILGVLVFAVALGWVPTSGVSDVSGWFLPLLTLTIRPLGVLTQVVRGAMISALASPYVRFARAKGATELRVVTRHALRNAAAPALTVAGDIAVGLVNGAVVVETIFGWPGIGKLMIESILQRDFAVLQAAVLLVAVAVFALNILIDLAYAVLDVRVREEAPA